MLNFHRQNVHLRSKLVNFGLVSEAAINVAGTPDGCRHTAYLLRWRMLTSV